MRGRLAVALGSCHEGISRHLGPNIRSPVTSEQKKSHGIQMRPSNALRLFVTIATATILLNATVNCQTKQTSAPQTQATQLSHSPHQATHAHHNYRHQASDAKLAAASGALVNFLRNFRPPPALPSSFKPLQRTTRRSVYVDADHQQPEVGAKSAQLAEPSQPVLASGSEEFVIASGSGSSTGAANGASLNSSSYSLVVEQQTKNSTDLPAPSDKQQQQQQQNAVGAHLQSDVSLAQQASPVAQRSPARLKLMQQFAPQQSQPVSSAPSSTSVIIPLHHPTSSFDNTDTNMRLKSALVQSPDSTSSSSLSKPLLVVGVPLSEKDYATAATGESTTNQPATSGGDLFELQPQKLAMPKSIELQSPQVSKHNNLPADGSAAAASTASNQATLGDKVSGPPLAYSSGSLGPVTQPTAPPQPTMPVNSPASAAPSIAQAQQQQQTPSGELQPRLFQNQPHHGAVFGNSPRRPSLPPPVNQANAASGFRSPLSPSGPLIGSMPATPAPALNYHAGQSAPYVTAGAQNAQILFSPNPAGAAQSVTGKNQQQQATSLMLAQQQQPQTTSGTSTMVTSGSQPPTGSATPATAAASYSGGRRLNITRVERK